MLALAAFVAAPSPAGAATPAVYSVVEGKDTASGRPVLVLLGNGLTGCKTFELTDGLGNPAGDVLLEVKSRNLLVLALPDGLVQGTYTLTLGYGKGLEQTHQVVLSAGQALPGTVENGALAADLRTDLDDAATLGGHSPAWYCDAANVDAGTLDPARFSAYDDLAAEGKIGSAAGQVAAGDHEHDARYYTKTQADAQFSSGTGLSGAGTINDAANPVDWTRLKGVPAGFADGTDADTTYQPGLNGGISFNGTKISVIFGGNGTAASVARSDHDHNGTYFTQSQLSATGGTVNAGANPVDWTRLKSVPAGFADGTDNDAWTTAGSDVYRSGGKVGIGTTSPAATLHVSGVDGALFQGTVGSGAIPVTGAGARMMWYPGKAAFRAGTVGGTEWDDANVGTYSTAAGISSRASGGYSVAMGSSTVASGLGSVALGSNSTASGAFAVATGTGTTASAVVSTAMGSATTATGQYSTAMGFTTTSQAFGSLVLGRFNVLAGSTSLWTATDPVLVVGNGASAASPANALTLLKNGDLSTSGSAVFNGTANAGTIPATGGAVRMMWYAGKYAFRAGFPGSDQWDDANVGYGSVAMCENTIASSDATAAFGWGTTASGSAATSLNFKTIASGAHSTSMGEETTAQAYDSVALGRFNVLAGDSLAWTAGDPVLVVGNGTSTSARANAFTLLKNGNLTIAGVLTENSDLRLKTDLLPLGATLAKIAALRGVSYRFKDAASHPSNRQIGLVAQEVREVFPELVQEGADGTLSVAYGNFSAVLVEAVKEQQAEIDRQKSALAEKDRELAALRKELADTRASVEERLARLEKASSPAVAPAGGQAAR
jgi:hypothetical protein